MNRKKLYSALSEKFYGDAAKDMKPQEIPTTLPSGRRCGVTVFNLYSQITSLLGNSDINQWSNYFFSPTLDDPFHLDLFSSWDHSTFNDIETSIWYERTRRSDRTQILVPICLFIDSTVLSLSGSLSLEPVMFSLMIHNRETRKQPDAWLPLGYIHDPTSIPGKRYRTTEERYADYHYMLSIILKNLMELVDESSQGLQWCFKNVPGQRKPISKRLHFRLAFVIGDSKGHDILCGRMASHNLTPGLCRDCDMRTENADNPTIPCCFLKQKDLSLKTIPELKDMSFYRIPYFTFNALSFGASPYGVNGATAIDIIHGILIGMMEYLYSTFTDQLTGKQMKELSNTVAFIATFCSRGIPGFVECHRFRKGICNVKGIMTAKMKLSRCFLVFMAMRTSPFYAFLKDQTGKLPSAIQSQNRKKAKNERINLSDISELEIQQDIHSTGSSTGSFYQSNDSKSGESDDWIDEKSNPSDYSNSDSNNISASPPSSSCGSTSFDVVDSHSFQMNDSYNSDDDSTYNPHEDFDNKDPIIFTDDVYLSWRDMFENMLLLYGWLTKESMPCSDFKLGSGSVAKYCCEKFMEKYKEVAYRFEGMGLKLTKYHQIRHWYFYISMYGVPSNFDSSFCESHHIYLSKRTGRRTQKRQDDLARQTAERVYESNLLSIALRKSKNRIHRQNKQRGQRQRKHKSLRGAKFQICFNYSDLHDAVSLGHHPVVSNRNGRNLNALFDSLPKVDFSWCQKRNVMKRHFPDLILSSIHKKLSWFNNGDSSQRISSIQGYTELRLQRQSESSKEKQRNIIRSHPDYRGKGIWFDWVDVVWEVEHDEEDNTSTITLPARVVMILDFQSATYEPIPDPILMLFPLLSQGLDNLLHRRRDGIQLLVHSASEEAEWDADVPNSIAERYSMEPFFQLIHFENIAGVVFVARDPPNHNNLDDMDYRITCVVHRTQWGSFFIPHLRRGYVAPNKSNFHLDEFNVDDNPW